MSAILYAAEGGCLTLPKPDSVGFRGVTASFPSSPTVLALGLPVPTSLPIDMNLLGESAPNTDLGESGTAFPFPLGLPVAS